MDLCVLHVPPLFSSIQYIGFITGMWNQKTNREKVLTGKQKDLKEGKLSDVMFWKILCRSQIPTVCCSWQTIEKLIICLLKGDTDQQYAAILMRNQKPANSNKQWPGTEKNVPKGKVSVAWVRVQKASNQNIRKNELMSGLSLKKDTNPRTQKIAIFVDVSSSHNPQK